MEATAEVPLQLAKMVALVVEEEAEILGRRQQQVGLEIHQTLHLLKEIMGVMVFLAHQEVMMKLEVAVVGLVL